MAIETVNPAVHIDQPACAEPPVAKVSTREQLVHGELLRDDYFWLRNKQDPEVAAYLNAENTYADAFMADTGSLQENLYREILSHIEETDVEAPYPYRGYYYYVRTEAGKQYPIYCRKKGSLNAPEEITLDLNALAEGHAFLSLGAYRISDCGNLVAFSLDTTGFRQYTLQFKDLSTGTLLPDRIANTGSVEWAADNKNLFYTMEDNAKRDYRVYRHELGSSETDELIYEEKDELYRVGIGRTRSREYLLLTVASFTTSEVRYVKASTPKAAWKLVTPRITMHEYYLDHHTDSFFILTNDKGINFRLVAAPVENPSPETWAEIISHRSDVMLENLLCFQNHIALVEREHGLPQIKVLPLSDGDQPAYRIPMPEQAYSASPTANFEFDTNTIRYNYQSMVTPPSTYDFNMADGSSVLVKQTHVPGSFDTSNYVAERVYATALDGARIPISLVRRKDTPVNGTAPLLLGAYGAYGISSTPYFSSASLALLDRGFVYAIAQIRGGGDLGKAWHDAGRMFNKRNTFTDFIASAEYLLTAGYGSPHLLAVTGGSAGGLLMGAIANLRPNLFRVVISKVPFVDVINTMLDETLPLTVGEFEEWGNPKIKTEYEYIKSYCPYSNLESKDYPATLIKTSFNDSQVMYWEPAKYVAKLRTLKTDDSPLLLKTNMAGGHGGSSGRYDRIRELAYDYAFLLKVFNL